MSNIASEACSHRPLVVLLQQDRPHEPNHRGGIREDADDVRPPFDLLVEAFERVRAVQLSLMLEREMAVGQDVLGGLLQHGRRPRKAGAQAIGDLPQLRHRRGMVRLRKDRADDGRDRFPHPVRHRGQQIPHEMHPAPLPRGARQDGADRLLQPLVRIGR